MNWLLLRGLAREQRHWNGFPAKFEAVVPGARAFCLDLPGTGTEYLRRSPATVADIVRDLRRRWMPLREANPGAWGLFGISLGGMVTMQWARDFSADFQRIAIANTSAGNVSPPWHRMDLRVVPRVLASAAYRDTTTRERTILGMTTNLLADKDAVAREWARYAEDRPMSRANLVRQLVAAMRFEAAEKLSMPVLVLSSAKDGFTSPECPKRLAARFGATIAVHPEANHDISSDAPEWVAEQIRAWVAGGATQAA